MTKLLLRSDPQHVVIYNDDSKRFSIESRIDKSESDWKKILTDEQFWITRKASTERPFSRDYYQINETGLYACICCGTHLFHTSAKLLSKSGWPEFEAVIAEENILLRTHVKYHHYQLEVMCARCDAHLGRLKKDASVPLKKRYCINSTALSFIKTQEVKENVKGEVEKHCSV